MTETTYGKRGRTSSRTVKHQSTADKPDTQQSNPEADLDVAAERFAQVYADFDPATAEVDDTSDVRVIADIVDEMERLEARLVEQVTIVRARGRSWTTIGRALRTSRQAARERFTDRTG